MDSTLPLPKRPKDALFNGISFCQIGAWPMAQLYLEHCLRLEPGHIRARYYLGITQFRLRKYNDAVHTMQRMQRSGDKEAQLAAQMLRKSFLLEDGDARYDVKFLYGDALLQMCEAVNDGDALPPNHFARFAWPQSPHPGLYKDIAFDLSIVLGPKYQWVCVLPQSQAYTNVPASATHVPVYICPAKVFDYDAAMHLFFLRALYDARQTYHRFTPPDICQTSFPKKHRDVLLHRVFPHEFAIPPSTFGDLFKVSMDDIRRMSIKNLD